MVWTKIAELRGPAGYNATGAAADDAAIAAFIAESAATTATGDALRAKYRTAVKLDTFPGVDPTGVTECSSAIQSALNAASAAGIPLVSGTAQYNINATVTIKDDADLSRAVFNYTGTGIAIIVGNPPASISRKTIRTPYVIALSKTVIGWGQVAGSVGVRVVNTSDCTVQIGTVRNFETGLQFRGETAGNGVTYSEFYLGTLLNNKRNLQITSDGAGYANQNQTFGGAFNFDAAEGTAVAGTRHILIDSVASAIDGWTFHQPSLEDSGGVVEATIDSAGNNILFDQGRYETASGIPRAFWKAGSLANEIRGGVNVDAIVETLTGTTANRIVRNSGPKVITTARTLNNTDEGKTLICNIAGGGSLSLPAVAGRSPGTTVIVKNINATTVSINTTTDNLDGVLTAQNILQWASKTFVSVQLPSPGWVTV